jgi:peroxiredoxin Q/BCP
MTNFGFDLTWLWSGGYDRHLLPPWAMLMLEVGTRAPEFTLPDQDGRDMSLSTLLNRGPVILYFYPADFTPGCTRQACSIRDLYSEVLRVGFTVAGISPQKSARHLAFRERYKLPFTLLSDPDKSVIKMYDVDGPLGFGVRRATFLIDPARFIRGAMLADFRISQHANFIHRALAMSSR